MNTPLPRPNHAALIFILGVLTALCPFSIDMYLPAFPVMAQALGIPVARLSLSLSSFFIGLAFGQLFYGPLLDRFGRKRPLYAGLAIYIVATLGCLMCKSVESLVVLRFIEALGGCAASVAAMAMVRDFFTGKESAKVFSLLVLILGVSPLLAPTVGSRLSAAWGWPSIFVVLALIAAAMLVVSIVYLPEGHPPDHEHSLRPGPVFRSYLAVLREPAFTTYAVAGSFAFAGLFVYLAASPLIFMEVFHIEPKTYSWIFALIAAGFVVVSQTNFILLRRFSNEQVALAGLILLTVDGLVFLISVLLGGFGLWGTVALFFCALACVGITNPNASALALAPFSKKAGTAAACLGFLQMAVGSVASVGVGLLKTPHMVAIASLFAAPAALSLVTVIVGRRAIARSKTNNIASHLR